MFICYFKNCGAKPLPFCAIKGFNALIIYFRPQRVPLLGNGPRGQPNNSGPPQNINPNQLQNMPRSSGPRPGIRLMPPGILPPGTERLPLMPPGVRPPLLQGHPPNLPGPPINMQGPPQNMQGPPQNMQGLPLNLQRPPLNIQRSNRGPPSNSKLFSLIYLVLLMDLKYIF